MAREMHLMNTGRYVDYNNFALYNYKFGFVLLLPCQSLLQSGPVSYASYDSVSFVAEQVSHHPPGQLGTHSRLL